MATPFPSGAVVAYRIRAKNNKGLGSPSKALNVTCDRIPSGMTSISITAVNPMDITISWSELTNTTLNGGDLPIFYSVEWSSDNATWTVVNANGPWGLYFTHRVAEPFVADSK